MSMQDFLRAISGYMDAEAAIEIAEANCERSRGHYLYDHYEKRDKTLKECETQFDIIIDAAIAAATAE